MSRPATSEGLFLWTVVGGRLTMNQIQHLKIGLQLLRMARGLQKGMYLIWWNKWWEWVGWSRTFYCQHKSKLDTVLYVINYRWFSNFGWLLNTKGVFGVLLFTHFNANLKGIGWIHFRGEFQVLIGKIIFMICYSWFYYIKSSPSKLNIHGKQKPELEAFFAREHDSLILVI